MKKMAKAVNPTSILPLQMQGEAQEGFSTGIFNFKLVHYRQGDLFWIYELLTDNDMDMCRSKSELRGKLARNVDGFTLLETLVAIVIFSIALMGMSSVSLSIVNANRISKHLVEASVLAQDTLESLRTAGFSLGSDAILGTSDDTIPQGLANPNTSNDTMTGSASLFANPDHAYAVSSTDVEDTTTILDSPSFALTKSLRRAWVVKDNTPSVGMKTVTVIVGWKDGKLNQYVTVSSAIQGQ